MLLALLVAERPPQFALDRLAREYELNDELDAAWAAHPLELVREDAGTLLVLEDPGGEPLARLLGAPMEAGGFFRLAIEESPPSATASATARLADRAPEAAIYVGAGPRR